MSVPIQEEWSFCPLNGGFDFHATFNKNIEVGPVCNGYIQTDKRTHLSNIHLRISRDLPTSNTAKKKTKKISFLSIFFWVHP